MKTTNGDAPPPSTIAAQIVHNRANVAREEPENQELFSRLLQEYLDDPVAEETSLETNAQLISVVAEAGLDAVQKGDPFAPDAATRRAVDSIQVLRLTARRNPRVLFYNGKDTCTTGASPPLILVLLPKLLALAGKKDVNEEIVTFLNDAVELALASIHLLQQGSAFLELIRIVIDGKLHGILCFAPTDVV